MSTPSSTRSLTPLGTSTQTAVTTNALRPSTKVRTRCPLRSGQRLHTRSILLPRNSSSSSDVLISIEVKLNGHLPGPSTLTLSAEVDDLGYTRILLTLPPTRGYCLARNFAYIKYFATSGAQGYVFVDRAKFTDGQVELMDKATFQSVVYVQFFDECQNSFEILEPYGPLKQGRIVVDNMPDPCE